LGGELGSGKQYFTWIHEDEFLTAALWTVENPLAAGIYNLTSPEPVTNAEFMQALRYAMGSRAGISLPEWLMEIGGKVVGTEPYLILDGRRIIPQRLVDSGFQFRYSEIQQSLKDLFKRD
jgi:NAD dependent epimerase/dehydratase family enzyme